MTKEKKGMSGETLYKIFIYVVLITLAVVIIVPVAWVFLASIKQNSEFYGNPWALPAGFYWQNFVEAYTTASTTRLFSKNPLPIRFFSHRSPSRSIRKMGTTM